MFCLPMKSVKIETHFLILKIWWFSMHERTQLSLRYEKCSRERFPFSTNCPHTSSDQMSLRQNLNLQNLTLSPSQDCYVWKMGTSEHRFEKMKKNLKNSAGFVKGPRSSGTVILSVNWTFPRKDQKKNSRKKSLYLKCFYMQALNTAQSKKVHLFLFATDFLTTDIENHDASGSDKNPLFSCSSWS